MNVLENAFIKEYIKSAVADLKLVSPNLPDKYLENFVQREVCKYIVDQPVNIKNTYTEFDQNTTLLSVLHFVESEKPIVCGNGSFYVHQTERISEISKMLMDFRARRTEFKNKMFKCEQNGDKLGYISNNLAQNNEKIKMNSMYGSSGESNSFQYNPACAGAVTSQGRSVITTTMWFDEAFLGGNIGFETLTDLTEYIRQILAEENHLELYEWVDYLPTDDDIIRHYISKFEGKEPKKMIIHILIQILNNATDTQKVKLYYKNNLIEFIDRNPKVKGIILDRILSNNIRHTEDKLKTDKTGKVELDENNNPIYLWKNGDVVEFLDPNKVPDEFQEPMDLLWNIFEEFVYMKNFIMYNKVDKYIHHKRSVIMYSDTDSVFIYLGFWIFKMLEYLRGWKYEDISLKQLESEKSLVLKIANILIRIVYIGIHKTYDTLASNVNIAQDYRKYINIKNEFLMDRYIGFPNIKKNYINRVIVQEGNIFENPKIDTKGGNLNAKSKNKLVTKRVNKTIEDVTMNGDKILPEELLYDIYHFRDDIESSLRAGEITYLAPIKVKNPEEYTNPYSQSKYLAVEAYRIATDDKTIDLPGSFNLIDVNMEDIKSLDYLRDNFPEIYNRLKTGFYENKNLGKHGIKYIAIPMRLEKIPDWIVKYVNVDDITRKHLSPLTALLPSLGISQDTIKSKTYYSTCLCI